MVDKSAICRDYCGHMKPEFRRIHRVLLILAFGWCFLIVVAPLLRASGFSPEIPNLLYRFFSRVCHQFNDRSLHLGGEKLAVCIRCSSIYFSFLIGLILYPLLQRWHEGKIPSRIFLLTAVVPMLIDVILNFSGLHFSTLWTRLATGACFGGILPLFILPPLLEAAPHVFHLRRGSLHAGKTK